MCEFFNFILVLDFTFDDYTKYLYYLSYSTFPVQHAVIEW